MSMLDNYKHQKRKNKLTGASASVFPLLATVLTTPFFLVFKQKPTAKSSRAIWKYVVNRKKSVIDSIQ